MPISVAQRVSDVAKVGVVPVNVEDEHSAHRVWELDKDHRNLKAVPQFEQSSFVNDDVSIRYNDKWKEHGYCLPHVKDDVDRENQRVQKHHPSSKLKVVVAEETLDQVKWHKNSQESRCVP